MTEKPYNLHSSAPAPDLDTKSDGVEAITNLSRRGFLTAAGGFVLGVALGGRVLAQSGTPSSLSAVQGGDATPSLWITIEKNGLVKITCHRSEMGQQVWTSMAQIVADELEVDWQKVEVIQALGDTKYGDQNTDGSKSVRLNFNRMRIAGAAMQLMLKQAAAAQWNIDTRECRAELGSIFEIGTGRKLSYGELSTVARTLPVPSESEIHLKTPDQWRYITKPMASKTVPAIVRGQGTYGIDVDRPGMVFAVIARPPQVFGTTGKVDDVAALAVPGVTQIIRLPDSSAPARFNALGGLAVVGTDTWAAIQGRAALDIEWLDGPNASYNSISFREELEKTSHAPGDVCLDRGDALSALSNAERIVTADYYVPHLAHTPMEPPSATAEWTDGRLECWACVQNPQAARGQLAKYFDMKLENVTVHATWLGGAFGRKAKPDFVVEAALISRDVGRPVKVTWTREDDIRHDYYHTVSAQHFEGAMDGDGRCTAFLHRTVFPPIRSTFVPGAETPASSEMGMGATNNPFYVPNLRVESGNAPAHIRIGWLRSVANIHHAFGVQSFASELAHAAGRDPKDYLLELIGSGRKINPIDDGADYPNHKASKEDYPIDTERLSNVTRTAAEMAGWGRTLPEGHGLGIAAHRSFLSYVATVIEVAVDTDGKLSIPGVWLALDAGVIVNPKHARAQMEGGTIFGLSNALYGEITVKEGAVEQSNFPNWRVLRMNEAPLTFEVEIMPSTAAPAGVGEPGTPPAAPALANAIFAATGQRIRSLPILGASGQRLAQARKE